MATRKKNTRTKKAKAIRPLKAHFTREEVDYQRDISYKDGFAAGKEYTERKSAAVNQEVGLGSMPFFDAAKQKELNQIHDERIKNLLHSGFKPFSKLDDNLEQFSTDAVRRKTSECRLDLIPLEALEGYGDRLHYGAIIREYGDRNWEAGIPYANLIQHSYGHLARLAAQIGRATEIPEHKYDPREQSLTLRSGEDVDTIYGNACALLWNAAAIVTLLRRGNPAEKKP